MKVWKGVMRRLGAGAGAAALLVAASGAATAQAPPDPFPRPEILKPAIAFWTRVFSEFSEHQVVLTSIRYPNKIYTILDYRFEANSGMNPVEIRRRQTRDEKFARAKIDAVLKRVHELRNTPEKMTGEERRVYDLWADVRDSDKFKKEIGNIRSQRGLKERTQKALEIAGAHLPHMESTFRSYNLPIQLTRLPIVESSFNIEAYSKVGAAGVWQFIPSSAKIYMRLNEAVDDRRDPWTSTDAAARHLRDDYRVLGQWPLAVTAYNYGRSGIARALREVGGSTLEDLLLRFQSPRFGFASRNYYAEFLAAVDVEREYRRHFGEVARRAPVKFDVVATSHYLPYETLQRLAGADDEQFRILNPGYRPEVMASKLYVPPSTQIRVPAGRAEAFRTAYGSLSPQERFDAQRQYFVQHRVKKGENLGKIARKYRISVGELQRANGISNSKKLRIGQLLKIPPRSQTTTRVVTAAKGQPIKVKVPANATVRLYQLHKVQKGQTLHSIARRYNSSVKAIVELNALNDPRRLKAGQTIKIPNAKT